MIIRIILVITLFTSLLSSADDSGHGKVIVHSVDEKTDLDALSSNNYKKRYGLNNQLKHTMPSTTVIKNAFKNAGLTQQVKSYDQLKKDVLYQNAQKYSVEKLREKYPRLNKESLVKLQQEIKK